MQKFILELTSEQVKKIKNVTNDIEQYGILAQPIVKQKELQIYIFTVTECKQIQDYLIKNKLTNTEPFVEI